MKENFYDSDEFYCVNRKLYYIDGHIKFKDLTAERQLNIIDILFKDNYNKKHSEFFDNLLKYYIYMRYQIENNDLVVTDCLIIKIGDIKHNYDHPSTKRVRKMKTASKFIKEVELYLYNKVITSEKSKRQTLRLLEAFHSALDELDHGLEHDSLK